MSVVGTEQFQYPFTINAKGGIAVNKPNMDYFFKRSQLPYIGEIDMSRFVTDADLKKLEYSMIEDTFAHRHETFWKDNSAQSFAYQTIAVLLGEGINVTIKDDPEAQDIIFKWNDEINVRHETIEDFIGTVWLDNLIDAQTLWRVFIDEDDEEHKVDIQRVSMKNVKIETHATRGWRRFIQTANIPTKHVNDKNRWYRSNVIYPKSLEMVQTIIPDEPQCCIYINFFKMPPVSSVMHLMVYKRWITWFMRKFAEKYWAPFIIAYLGDPKSGYFPTDPKDQDDGIRYNLEALKRIRNYGVGSFLGHTKIETLDTKSAKNSDVYVNYLEYLNKEIILGLLGSMALREASGREKATSDIVQQGYLRFIRGKRESIGIHLRKFYAKVLLPAYGKEGIDPTDIKIDWPPLKIESIKDTLQAVEIAAKIGAFKDAKEIRKILTPIWRHIGEDITDEEAKKMKETFLEINSPSRAMGDSPQQRTGSNQGQPKAKSTTANK